MESYLKGLSPGGWTSTEQFFRNDDNSEKTKEDRKLWYKFLLLSANEFEDIYKQTFNKFKANQKSVIKYNRDIELSDFKVYLNCKVKKVWTDVIVDGLEGRQYDEMKRKELLTEYAERGALYEPNVVHDFLHAYSIVRDEIALYRRLSKSKEQASVKEIKNTLRGLYEQENVNILAMCRTIAKCARKARKIAYAVIEKLLEFKTKTATSTSIWLLDITSIIQEIDEKVLVETLTRKITDDGLILDDGMPHNTSSKISGGTFKLLFKRTKQIQKHQTLYTSVLKSKSEHDNAMARVFAIAGAEYSDSKYDSIIGIELAKLAQGKYMATFAMIQSFITRFINSIESMELTQETKIEISKLKEIAVEKVTLCWDSIFTGDHLMVSRVLGYMKDYKRLDEGAGDYNMLYSRGLYGTSEFGIQLRDDVMVKHNELMSINYLCNSLYILTHTSIKKNGQLPGVVVYFVFVRNGTRQAVPALMVTTRHCTVYKDWTHTFKNYFNKFQEFTPLLTTNGITKDVILQLKMDVYENYLRSPYIQLKKAGSNEIMTTLQAVAEYMSDMVGRKVIHDVMITTRVCMKDNEFRIFPHLPYKYLKRGDGPKFYQNIDFSGGMKNVMGANSVVYTAPTLFTVNNYFGKDRSERVFSYMLDLDLIRYIENNAVECFTNYFFVKRLCEEFEDLRLGYNFQLIHYAGYTPLPKHFKLFNKEILLIEPSIDYEVSNSLEDLKPMLLRGTVVQIDPIEFSKEHIKEKQAQTEDIEALIPLGKRKGATPKKITLKKSKSNRDL